MSDRTSLWVKIVLRRPVSIVSNVSAVTNVQCALNTICETCFVGRNSLSGWPLVQQTGQTPLSSGYLIWWMLTLFIGVIDLGSADANFSALLEICYGNLSSTLATPV